MTKSVLYSQSLVQSLENSLKLAFNQRYLRLTRPSNPGASFYVQLQDGTATAQLEDASEQTVLEIYTSDNQSSAFYFGFVAAFVITATRRYSLQDASISVFHIVLEDLMPLFRAEWHQLAASDETSRHAQPHWHFVQRPERIERIVRNSGRSSETAEFDPDQTSELFSKLADSSKFHFAMTSQWEKNANPPYKRIFDSEDFPKWFAGLTHYIAGQIDYLVSRTPARVTDFEPS